MAAMRIVPLAINGGILPKIAFGTALVILVGMKVHKVQGSNKMVNFTNFNRTATAAIGALVISTAFIAAATGPAYAVEPAPASFASVQTPLSVQANA